MKFNRDIWQAVSLARISGVVLLRILLVVLPPDRREAIAIATPKGLAKGDRSY